MSKPKILFILHLPPPVHGAGMMGNYMKESSLINETFEASYINLSTSETIGAVGKADKGKLVTLLRLIGKVLKSLISKKNDLYYVTLTATGPGFYKDTVVVVLLKLFGKKIIYHFHNKGIEKNTHQITHYLYRLVFRNTKAILLSPSLYIDIKKYLEPKNVFFCANGIPDKIENPFTLTQKNEPSVCNLLFLSNLLEEKGVYILLQACKQLAEQNVPFICHFVGPWGDITEKEFSVRVSNYKLSENIVVHGRKYGTAKEEILKLADLFVFPTYYHNECFPLVILEAMQFSLPVISTFEGGIPDIVAENETGFLVPQKNVHELAIKMRLLIEEPSLRLSMGKAGYERFKNNFTLAIFEKEMTATLQKAIHRKQ